MRGAMAFGSLAAGLFLPACSAETLVDDLFTEAEWTKIARFSPLPPPPSSPTNRLADDPAAAQLGQRLWFEKRYAGPITAGATDAEGGLGPINAEQMVSCANCHDPASWFNDARLNNKCSMGTAKTKRNAPSMINAVYYEWGNWAGSHDQFWKQGANSPESKDNFNSTRLRYAHVIYEYYRDDYEALFGALPSALAPGAVDAARFPPKGKPGDPAWEGMEKADQDAVNTIMANCGKTLEAYERLLVSRGAPFDRYVAGDYQALSSSAKRGLRLFIGKAGCDTCHKGQTFTDQDFHNTGVAQDMPFDNGLYDDVTRLDNPFNGAGEFSDDKDAGRAKLERLARDRTDDMKGQFRTKSLRHVAQTAPYFHNGSKATLLDVVRFYNEGGAMDATTYPGLKDDRIVPLNLTESEMLDLVSFLESLTGDPIPSHLTENTSALGPVGRLGNHIAVD